MCEEIVNIYLMDSIGKEHSSDKKTEQPGTCLMWYYRIINSY